MYVPHLLGCLDLNPDVVKCCHRIERLRHSVALTCASFCIWSPLMPLVVLLTAVTYYYLQPSESPLIFLRVRVPDLIASVNDCAAYFLAVLQIGIDGDLYSRYCTVCCLSVWCTLKFIFQCITMLNKFDQSIMKWFHCDALTSYTTFQLD